MQIREQVFFRRYQSLSTDELVQIGKGGDLLPEARSALQSVLAERGEADEPMAHGDAPQRNDAGPVPHENTAAAISSILWWLYFAGALVATLYGIRAYLSDSCAPLTTYSCTQVLTYFVGATDLRVGRIEAALLLSFHFLALYACYGYIRQIPSLSRLFWMLFAGFFLLKTCVFGLLFVAQARDSPYLYPVLLNILIYAPLWVALGLYAFASKRLWQADLRALPKSAPY